MSNVTEITSAEFEQQVEQYQGRVLIDFYAPWCAPCKVIAPLITQIADENSALKVLKINVDDAQELMIKYGIRGLPTLLLAEQGKVVASKVGATSLNQLRAWVNHNPKFSS